ncbi:MAG: hypothetical protein WCX97_03720 [Candidatus Magasanikbacteria bacterium]|jgi:DNA repair exonuclease SbcCD ATPase subunit
MQEIQEVFNRIKETQKKQKDIRSAYKDALAGSGEYREIIDQINTLREKKKKIEGQIRNEFNQEFSELDVIQNDITSDRELLSDIALSQFMKGETIMVKDEYDNEYEPTFTVKFKKT